MKYFPILIFLLFPFFCFAQEVDTKQQVQSMFENKNKIQWVKHFKGRLDDMNDVSVTLGFDGKNCKGQMTYLRSNTKFNLFGNIDGNQLAVVEMDNAAKVSGTLRGNISGKTIIGNWSNFDNSKGGNLWLTETDKEIKFPSFCGDNKWIRKYDGKIEKERVEIILQKESNQKLSGLIFYKRTNKTFVIKGNVDGADNFELTLKNQRGEKVNQLNGNLFQDQITFIEKNNSEKNTLQPIEGLTIGCIEYADYTTGYDITFPKTTNASFNKQMQEETDAWIKACRKHALKIKKQNDTQEPKTRSAERGFAWCEVDFFSEKIISGYMTFSNTWTPGQKLIAYSYNFENNRSIYLEDIFKKDKDYKKHIRNFIKKEIKKHKLYSNSDFKKWIRKSDFNYFTIRKDGICFSTKFNMLYGRQSVTIPFSQLQPFLKKSFLKLLSE